jgi:hypothetical protein
LQLVLIACFGLHYDKTAMSLAVIEKLGALIPELSPLPVRPAPLMSHATKFNRIS